MKRPSWTAAAVVTALAAIPACGGSTPPPSTSDPAGGGERITGRERLGWTQSAADATELASFRYAAYVDNNRVELAAATCGGIERRVFLQQPDAADECRGPLDRARVICGRQAAW